MARIELEDFKDAFGNDVQALIAGHDIDAYKRQRNREFVGSGNYKPTKKWMYTLLKHPRQGGARRQNRGHQPPNIIPSSAQYHLWIQPVRYPNRMRLCTT
jgi:hypothetical protein